MVQVSSSRASNGGLIRAAGVVLLRQNGDKTQVCVVHRPRRKDWSLPKGKLERGESALAAAHRETMEETGANCVVRIPLATERYRVEGRAKTVQYWVADYADGGPGFTPNHEIDEVLWLSPDKAARKLTYPRDVQLMRAAVAAPVTTPLIILRHGEARKRANWSKADNLRPLTSGGQREAVDLAELLGAYGISSLHSSDAARCVQTLTPYADEHRLSVQLEHRFNEEGFVPKKRGTLRVLDGWLADPTPSVICTHRPVIPHLITHIVREFGLTKRKQLNTALLPGGFIVLHREFHPKKGLRIAAIERHEP